jgi:hypothetical protein
MHLTDFFRRLATRDLAVIVDQEAAHAAALAAGFRTLRSSEILTAVQEAGAALWLMSSREAQRQLREQLWNGFEGTLVHLTDAKAGGDPATAAYVLACLDAADLPATVATRRHHYERFLSDDLLDIRTGDATLLCRIGETVEVACDADALEPGVPYALTELLKASIVNIEGPTSTFRLDGEVIVDDLLFQANSQPLLDAHAPMLRDWRRLMAQGRESRIAIADNRVTGLILGGGDRTGELLGLCQDKEWETTVTECAVGVLDLPPERSLNTVFSQTRRGLHIGLGMGEQLPFLDFCAPDARIEPDAG